MKLITIQHKSALESLLNNGIYQADYKYVKSHLQKPYKFMCSEYGYKSCPIFLGIVGLRAELAGAGTGSDFVAMEFDIPDEYIRIQRYYFWSDFIYFCDFPDEFPQTEKFPSVDEFGRFVVNEKVVGKNYTFQATVEILRVEWLTAVSTELDMLTEFHMLSGGKKVLQPLSFYCNR